MHIPSIPFKVLALAPFRYTEKTPWQYQPIGIDKTSFDQAIEDLDVSFDIIVPRDLCKTESLSLGIKRLKDFHPDSVGENNAFLKNLAEARKFVRDAIADGLSDEHIYERLVSWPDIPIEFRYEKKQTKAEAESAIDAIFSMVAMPDTKQAVSAKNVQGYISQIDAVLQQLLSRIYEDVSFRNLESYWKGLRFLMQQGGANGEISFEIVPVSIDTLEETLDHLMSSLIEDLPSLVILDLPFDNSPRCLDLLEKVAVFSETLLVPALCFITPKFLYLDRWEDMKRLPFLPHYLEEQAYAKWRQLRNNPSARWLTMTCNRFYIRYPYGPSNTTASVVFNEKQGLLASPVWALGSLICKSMVTYGWPTRFTDWQNIRLEDLALNVTEDGKELPTETFFNEERIDQFMRCGIMPLMAKSGKDVAFMPVETTLSGGSLKYQLFLSRITRFLFRCKDAIGRDMGPSDIEKQLKTAFLLFWQKTGHAGPKDFALSVSQPGPEQRYIVRFSVEPPRDILPSGEKIEMDFPW